MNAPQTDSHPQVPRQASVAVWVVVGAVAVATAAARLWGPRAGCTLLCVTLIGLAVARVFGPEPGLPGVAVRSRSFDVGVYLVLAALLGGLAWTTGSFAV